MSADRKDEAAEDAPAKPARFDEALQELETLVETLEQGDLSLDESLARFERGVSLARECRDALTNAEQRVQVLLENEDGNDSLAPFASESDDESGDDDRE
ncbi:MAG: exodeoxyribonuclease VII small subunit [Halofilum sp. (in: g-proteobacteria)]|nr:exodeoxyribonuclease VII small subunit [Halofilum sp. (in: g-proteobacteria)]